MRNLGQKVNTTILVTTVLGFALYIHDIGKTVKENSQKIEVLAESVETQSERVETLDESVETLSTNFETLSERVETLSTNFETLSATVAEGFAKLSNSIETVAQDMNENTRQIKQALARIEERVKNNETAIQTHRQSHELLPREGAIAPSARLRPNHTRQDTQGTQDIQGAKPDNPQ